MFKATLLGQWHNLSDPKLEHALTVRINVMHFCGLTLVDPSPDESTLCRFRNRLIKASRLAPLLAAVNAQLQAHGLMVAQTSGAVIDATLVASATRPRSQRIIESEDGADAAAEIVTDVAVAPTVTETLSADPDATRLNKGKKNHFGFRSYASVDAQDGFVRSVHTAPANQSETAHFEAAVKSADFKPKRTYADKGFASEANRQHLRGQGIKSAIMHKAKRNQPRTQRQRNANKAISKTRYIVEQCFGTMKRIFGMTRASYMGTEKVNAQFTIKAMCFNLLKAANKICLIDKPRGVVRAQCAK